MKSQKNASKKASERTGGHPLGLHRVLDSKRNLPQAAERLENSLPIYDNELLLRVERLNIDAASFVQMEKATGGNAQKIGELILQNCTQRGKQHNAITGSGGMLLGEVLQRGSRYKGPVKVGAGGKVATLVSLTLTPLHLEKVLSVDLETHQVEVEGHAILFETGIAAAMPKDLPERVALAAFDVAGAPAATYRMCAPGDTVVIVGAGGKAGILSCAAALKKVGKKGRVLGIEPGKRGLDDLKRLGGVIPLAIDATDPIEVHSRIEAQTRGKMANVVVNVASVPNTELGSILAAHPKGKILFFSMATSFTRAALGAEGVGCAAAMIFGNGFVPGHDRFVIGLLRQSDRLKAIFSDRYTS